MRSKGAPGNWIRRALPIVSTLMPVESEMKKTGTAVAAAPGARAAGLSASELPGSATGGFVADGSVAGGNGGGIGSEEPKGAPSTGPGAHTGDTTSCSRPT
ncbi:hypothetical protein GCM10009591_06170 [Brachybacterium tyrofermentans]